MRATRDDHHYQHLRRRLVAELEREIGPGHELLTVNGQGLPVNGGGGKRCSR
jgi:hypothetical protein